MCICAWSSFLALGGGSACLLSRSRTRVWKRCWHSSAVERGVVKYGVIDPGGAAGSPRLMTQCELRPSRSSSLQSAYCSWLSKVGSALMRMCRIDWAFRHATRRSPQVQSHCAPCSATPRACGVRPVRHRARWECARGYGRPTLVGSQPRTPGALLHLFKYELSDHRVGDRTGYR